MTVSSLLRVAVHEQLAAPLVLGGALDFVAVLVELAQVDAPLLFLLAPGNPATATEASAERQRAEAGQAHHREEAGLQRPDSGRIHHHKGSDDPDQQRGQRDHQQDVAGLAFRQRQWRCDRHPHRRNHRGRFPRAPYETAFGHA